MLGRPDVREGVAADLHRLAGSKRPLACRPVEARAGDADREQHDCGVDDVAAVPAPVSPYELEEGARPRSTRDRPAGLRSGHELDGDRGEHERREAIDEEAEERRARSGQDEERTRRDRSRRRPGERPPQSA
jgi:hypothetical protein